MSLWQGKLNWQREVTPMLTMNRKLFCCLVLTWVQSASCQEWSVIWGTNSIGALSSPSGPGARSGSSIWTDQEGKVWLFGGKGFSDLGEGSAKLLNDLWFFDMLERKWNLVHPGTVSKTTSDNNAPTPRQLAATCGVPGIILVVFGGLDVNDNGLDDTWVYYMQKSRWLPLTELTNYTSRSNNNSITVPSARGDMTSWCMVDNMLIFGGMDYSKKLFSDMWKFSMKDLNWSLVVIPSSEKNDSDVLPLGRNGATSWMVNHKVLYMFGGNILNTNVRNRHLNFGYTSDMWRYFIDDNTWEFLRGYRHGCQTVEFGTKEKLSKHNHPGCRRRAAAWTDTNGDLWMYGGDGTDTAYPSVFHMSKLLNDLWYYNTTSDIWRWYGGGDVDHDGPHNEAAGTPGGRYEAMYWIGPQNTFYLMGGLGHDQYKHDGYLNDVWMVDLDDIVNDRGVSGGMIVLYLLLALALVLTMAGIFLYARDKRGTSVWSRLDQGVKYSQLTTTAD